MTRNMTRNLHTLKFCSENAADDSEFVDRICHGFGTAKRNTIKGKSGTTWYG